MFVRAGFQSVCYEKKIGNNKKYMKTVTFVTFCNYGE